MLSRREFLAHSAFATAAMALPFDLRRVQRGSCVVLDLEQHCGLRESLFGYTTALDERTPVIPRSFSLRMTGTVIIPGATHIDSSTAQLILSGLHQGGIVLLESGAVFADFREHREQLRDYFNILVEPPIDLWPAGGIPYVQYSWPIAAQTRDFSRVIPLAPQRGTVIARAVDIPVGLARRFGPGMLVYLGSPLGPALWAGDSEAKRWLGALTALGTTR